MPIYMALAYAGLGEKKKALEKAHHYRLLNEPAEAESICLDVLEVDPDHQQALVTLLLALTDRFTKGYAISATQAKEVLPRLHDEYQRAYYAGTCAAVKGAVGGLYWWDFELNPPAENDTGFVPQGKPAELEVGRCFAQPGIPN